MKALATIPALLFLAACGGIVDDTATPAAADIEQLESRLAAHPCIGYLARWERNYRFSRKAGFLSAHSLYPDLDVIEFHLRPVGTVRITAGRNVLQPRSADWPDSSPIKAIDGRYTLSSGALSLTGCPRR